MQWTNEKKNLFILSWNFIRKPIDKSGVFHFFAPVSLMQTLRETQKCSSKLLWNNDIIHCSTCENSMDSLILCAKNRPKINCEAFLFITISCCCLTDIEMSRHSCVGLTVRMHKRICHAFAWQRELNIAPPSSCSMYFELSTASTREWS